MVLKKAAAMMIALLSMCSTVMAGEFIVGFRGENNAFDRVAFREFASRRNLEPMEFVPHDIERASHVIRSRTESYELYGYSMGAWSSKQLLSLLQMNNERMPRHVTTVGAHPSVDVDFSHWGVTFSNYFDDSGRRHKSPGTHMPVPHGAAMKHVNQLQR